MYLTISLLVRKNQAKLIAHYLLLQTFRSYREMFEEQKATIEQRFRGLLEESIQDAVFLSSRNSELMQENQAHKQGETKIKGDWSQICWEISLRVMQYWWFNPLTLRVAKTGLVIMELFYLPKHFLEIIWRRNVKQKPNNNSPSNILWIFAVFFFNSTKVADDTF